MNSPFWYRQAIKDGSGKTPKLLADQNYPQAVAAFHRAQDIAHQTDQNRPADLLFRAGRCQFAHDFLAHPKTPALRTRSILWEQVRAVCTTLPLQIEKCLNRKALPSHPTSNT